MEILSLVLSALSLVLLILLLVRQNAGAARHMWTPLDDRLNKLQTELQRQEQGLRQELNSSVQTLGTLLSGNQRQAAQSSQDALARLEERLKTLESHNEQKLEAMRETISKRLGDIQMDNSQRLEQIRLTVNEKLQETLESKMNQSFERVSKQLEDVYKGLGEMQTLANGVGDLKKVLSNVKTRGILGEVQLGAILREILAPGQYEENVAVLPHSDNRVEFAVKLPGDDGGPVYLPIDSKFPGDAYAELQRAYDSGSPEEISAAFAILASRIKLFAKDIRDKYIEPPYTTNFGIMFLPFEGLYAEVVNRGLLETLQNEYNVNIAGPSTMAALLNSLQMGFKTIAIQKRSGEVWKVLGAVKAEFGKFEGVLTNTQRKLDNIGRDLDQLVGTRTRAINRKLRDVETLEEGESARLLMLAEDPLPPEEED